MSTISQDFQMHNLTIVVTCDTELQVRPLKLAINITNPAVTEDTNAPNPATPPHDVSSNAIPILAAPASAVVVTDRAEPPPASLPDLAQPTNADVHQTPIRTQMDEGQQAIVSPASAATVSSVTESYTSPQSQTSQIGGRTGASASPAVTVSSVTESYTSPQDALADTSSTFCIDNFELDTQLFRDAFERDPEGVLKVLERNETPKKYYGDQPDNDGDVIPDSLQSTRARAWSGNLRSPNTEHMDDKVSTPSAERKRACPTSDIDDLANRRVSSNRRRNDPDETPTKHLGANRRDRIMPTPTTHNLNATGAAVAGPTNAKRTLRYVSVEPVPLASGNEVRPEWIVEAEEYNRKCRAAFEAKLKRVYPN
ncbi:hypothetical protein SCHPADRAFT_998511 [Schizopora paradoxa]|uniref:Uncharacterized protein n=1 Tax=Schizopora paradoxa TaxID=27342 RepID=A0A0H2S4S8_9AGAM|nr:hypothetical protein SCHPADRAFT_998511 [Schizopora paradoxa]